MFVLRITPSSQDRKVAWLLWHYSEAPQKARDFSGLRETPCYTYYARKLTSNSNTLSWAVNDGSIFVAISLQHEAHNGQLT